MHDGPVAHPLVKFLSAWAGTGVALLGIHQWSDVAAILSSVLTLCFIVDWTRKRFFPKRPFDPTTQRGDL